MSEKLTQKQLDKKLKYWQKVLELRDWHIKARIVKSKDMPTKYYAGCVSWDLQYKAAKISILDFEDIPTDVIAEPDMEETLVHELLHLQLAPIHNDFGESTGYEMKEEQVINSLARALTKLHRKG